MHYLNCLGYSNEKEGIARNCKCICNTNSLNNSCIHPTNSMSVVNNNLRIQLSFRHSAKFSTFHTEQVWSLVEDKTISNTNKEQILSTFNTESEMTATLVVLNSEQLSVGRNGFDQLRGRRTVSDEWCFQIGWSVISTMHEFEPALLLFKPNKFIRPE